MKEKNDEKINVKTILPFGESLVPLIVSSFLTKSDLKCLLYQRGIFMSDTEKTKTIPIIKNLILSPEEFDFLREKQRIKEDQIKRTTQIIKLSESTGDINTVIKVEDLQKVNWIEQEYINYHFINPLKILITESNEIHLEYQIERKDKSKDWATNISVHEGRTILKLKDNYLHFVSEYTANETKDINSKIINKILKDLKKEKLIKPKEEIKKITFDSFNNYKRAEFIFSFIDEIIEGISFFQVTNADFGPDKSMKLPDNIDWMEKKVSNLILKGKNIDKTIFLNNKELYEFLIFQTIDADYKFQLNNNEFIISIQFGFPKYLKTEIPNTEFEIKILNLNAKENINLKEEKEVSQYVLDKFEDFKFLKYNQLKL